MRHPAGNVSAGNSVSMGAFDRSLGQLAMFLERFDQAQHHFEDALNLNETMGHGPALAFTRLNYGDMLQRRNGSAIASARSTCCSKRTTSRRSPAWPK